MIADQMETHAVLDLTGSEATFRGRKCTEGTEGTKMYFLNVEVTNQ